MVSNAHERVNSQGFPAFRRRSLTRVQAVHRFVKAKTCICCSGRQLLGFCQRQYFLFAAVHSCISQVWQQEKTSQIWKETISEQAQTCRNLLLHLVGFKEFAQRSKVQSISLKEVEWHQSSFPGGTMIVYINHI